MGEIHALSSSPQQQQQQPIALRSRCPTSTGMGGVLNDYSKALMTGIEDQFSLWAVAQSEFGVNSTNMFYTRSYLQTILLQIAKENLQGQCLPGLQCSAKK